MSLDCSNPGNNTQLASACACQAASNELQHAVAQYESEYEAYSVQQAAYQAAYGKWQTAHTAWVTKKQNDLHDFSTQVQQWNHCVLWTGVYGHDDWCSNDISPGWVQVGAGQYDCAYGSGRGNCSPGPSAIAVFNSTWLANNPEPQAPSPVPAFAEKPPTVNISCCSQLFQNITADSANFSGITQQCQQNITSQIAAAAAGTLPIPAKDAAAPGTGNQSSTTLVISIAVIIAIIIFLMLLFL